ncbi:GIY-YIG nuclease family protein [Sulfitobacter mediterraneus]|uniref:GIY-YIG nuclease family protein n=1 Tax=Sulfitobacter mediterraneus TaxID=83219 RepID=UPI00193A84D2|nr:GIY-YIG nuclease family protein [Sulfitobacter mediterraneus]MBM1556687.1 GIY-YIG nuclease family protein [Sulfitobacter mediterraneus]MBM1570116.1 GIY-YIG nuclease family protein [Sulfitobacter mediterraneus]MBM1574073.1 GIY-YIG nuclease family protein [Sulfitobacter mediterraneus]MBM1577858.1 GIY-YIG nuclease family protein [Sulfitobacter mediterraneus]MBM1579645.1 GIY-YIG nuclease family protein [Sulfitobacter mediterraneus]
MKTALYRHFDAEGALMYIGITTDPERRLSEHIKSGRWPIASVRVEWVQSALDAAAVERRAIIEENPKHNIRRETNEPPGLPQSGWRKIVSDALIEKGLSMRGASLEAGLGKGYLHSVLIEGKDPTLDNFTKICGVLELSAAEVIAAEGATT